MNKPCSFAKEHAKKLFDECLCQQLIISPIPRRPRDVDKVGELNFCPYHRILGHCLKDCSVLKKNALKQLIQVGVNNMEKFLVKPPQPYIANNPPTLVNVLHTSGERPRHQPMNS